MSHQMAYQKLEMMAATCALGEMAMAICPSAPAIVMGELCCQRSNIATTLPASPYVLCSSNVGAAAQTPSTQVCAHQALESDSAGSPMPEAGVLTGSWDREIVLLLHFHGDSSRDQRKLRSNCGKVSFMASACLIVLHAAQATQS